MTIAPGSATANERGAVAIIVAVLAVMLFSMAAMAVDLGNAWARKRAVQKQVDLSALSAGHNLPMTAANRSALAEEVATFLNRNAAAGQDLELVTGADLLNLDLRDGEIDFQHSDGTPCTDGCARMAVTSPAAFVEFGFARVLGVDGTDVQRTAAVQVMSVLPPKEKLIPFWLPSGCGYGPTDADTTQGGTDSDPVGCTGQDRGNFGQLDSPRLDGSDGQTRLARNIASGLDHLLAPFQWGPTQQPTESCGDRAPFISGAQPDVTSTSDPPRNCILGQTGNAGPAVYAGLISGIDGVPGRLDARNGATSALCDGRANLVVGAATLNNDVLSCFLRNGATLAAISSDAGVTPDMLDPSVIHSPRFVWLPVVYATDRRQKGFQPIVDFVPGFITDETQSAPATDANGTAVNGKSIKVLRVFTFNKDALPIDERSPTTFYDPRLTRRIVRLVA